MNMRVQGGFSPKHLARLITGLFALCALIVSSSVEADSQGQSLRLAVYLPQTHTRETYQPLAEYLSSRIGRPVKLVTTINFLTHWQLFKRENYELVLDGPHFTDYRVQKMGYRPVAKFPSLVSYSLVTSEDVLILEPDDLIGRKIAVPPSPGLGALWLNSIFTKPLQQPEIVEVNDSESAIKKVLGGQAAAAMIPTPIASRYTTVIPVHTTRQVPAPGLSVSPDIDESLAREIRRALLSAGSDPVGRAMLEAIGVPAFEPADEQSYKGQAIVLDGVWDY